MQAQDLLLFQAALGLRSRGRSTSVEFDRERKRLDLRIDFAKGARFPCPECERAGVQVHDTEEKTWRHLDFFQHQAYLTARVPRVDCPEHKVRQVAVPWARERSGFTLLFEALVMAMVREMPVATVAALVGEYGHADLADRASLRRSRRSRRRTSRASSGSGSMRPARGVGMTTCRCSPIWTSAAAVFVVEGRDHETVQAFSLLSRDARRRARRRSRRCARTCPRRS